MDEREAILNDLELAVETARRSNDRGYPALKDLYDRTEEVADRATLNELRAIQVAVRRGDLAEARDRLMEIRGRLGPFG